MLLADGPSVSTKSLGYRHELSSILYRRRFYGNSWEKNVKHEHFIIASKIKERSTSYVLVNRWIIKEIPRNKEIASSKETVISAYYLLPEPKEQS